MRHSEYFLPILKDDPADAYLPSHKLMLRSGIIRQQSSGIYSWLPLGVKLLQKISKIIREELNKIGAVEILLPCIQPAEFWIETGRYESYGKEMLKITDRHDNQLLFGPTAEDAITDLMRNNVKSYKELPLILYQTHWKFRDEIRPRFGVMRGREFLMKDAYSFDLTKEGFIKSYNKIFAAYLRIFNRIGIDVIPAQAETGPIGGDLSHEFHIIAENGESTIYYDNKLEALLKKNNPDIEVIKSHYAATDDIHNDEKCPIDKSTLKTAKSIEVGHVFNFGDKYTKAMNCSVQDQDGKLIHPLSGSYGIGVSRLIAAIIEASHDNKGIIWPKAVAPFDISLICLNVRNEACYSLANKLYEDLNKYYEVLFDDTEHSAGSKFATHDLIGTPIQIIIGPKLAKEDKLEVKYRHNSTNVEVEVSKLNEFLKTS